MALQEKQLAQARENSTSAVSIYSPGANTTAIIKNIIICNNTSSAVVFSIYQDDDGTTYDESTILMNEVPLTAKETKILSVFLPMDNSSGNLAYKSSVANAVTITVSGAEIT